MGANKVDALHEEVDFVQAHRNAPPAFYSAKVVQDVDDVLCDRKGPPAASRVSRYRLQSPLVSRVPRGVFTRVACSGTPLDPCPHGRYEDELAIVARESNLPQ
eukprot:54406_1